MNSQHNSITNCSPEEFWGEENTQTTQTADDRPLLPMVMQPVGELMRAAAPPAPELISGILRKGRIASITASSKAGKSFLLLELADAIAHGSEWLGHQCLQGGVIYINLEIAEDAMAERVRAVREAYGRDPWDPAPLYVCNLRGCNYNAGSLCDAIVNTISEDGVEDIAAIIVDPIYILESGDENSAGDQISLLRHFLRLAEETGAAVLYCHHYSKGGQGDKQAIDRSSGSGVHGRFPDAVISLTEIDTVEIEHELIEEARREAVMDWLSQYRPSVVEPRELTTYEQAVEEVTGAADMVALAAIKDIRSRTNAPRRYAYRMEVDARDFRRTSGEDIWWQWPVHTKDKGRCAGMPLIGSQASRDLRKAVETRRAKEAQGEAIMALLAGKPDGERVDVKALADALGTTQAEVRRIAKEAGHRVPATGDITICKGGKA